MIDVKVPKMGMNTTEVDIVAWHVGPGDRVAIGTPLAAIQSEKTSLTLAAAAAGGLVAILVPAGGPAAGPLTTVFGRGEPVITIDITRDPRWDAHRPLALTHGLRACWAVPVLSGDGRALGVLTVYFPAPRHPETADLELLEAAARLAAIAIERHQMIEQLAYQAHHDALTGLPNRVVYDDRLQQALARARRAQRLVALFMIDLDRFKQVNDSVGIAVGDSILLTLARRLTRKAKKDQVK